MSSSLAPSHNRFSILADPETHTNTNTCEPWQRLQLLHHDSQVTNIFSLLCLLTLLSKERRSGGGEDDMLRRGRRINYSRGFWGKWCIESRRRHIKDIRTGTEHKTCSRPGPAPTKGDMDGPSHHFWDLIYQSMRRKNVRVGTVRNEQGNQYLIRIVWTIINLSYVRLLVQIWSTHHLESPSCLNAELLVEDKSSKQEK